MIFPSCIWDIWINPNKRNPHQRSEKSETLKKKSEVINHFSSRNCFLIKYLCLRWRMAIFHYPFTNMKLSASYPLLSLIISFITQPRITLHTGGKYKKSPFKIINNQVLVLKRKVLNSSCWKQKCANIRKAQARKNKSKKKRERMNSSWNGAPEIEKEDKRTKVRSKILHMMILGPNTLKTHFGPIIISFVTLSHGLRYVPKKPISIKHEYWN